MQHLPTELKAMVVCGHSTGPISAESRRWPWSGVAWSPPSAAADSHYHVASLPSSVGENHTSGITWCFLVWYKYASWDSVRLPVFQIYRWGSANRTPWS